MERVLGVVTLDWQPHMNSSSLAPTQCTGSNSREFSLSKKKKIAQSSASDFPYVLPYHN